MGSRALGFAAASLLPLWHWNLAVAYLGQTLPLLSEAPLQPLPIAFPNCGVPWNTVPRGIRRFRDPPGLENTGLNKVTQVLLWGFCFTMDSPSLDPDMTGDIFQIFSTIRTFGMGASLS